MNDIEWEETVRRAHVEAERQMALATAMGAECPKCGNKNRQTAMVNNGRANCPGHGSYWVLPIND